MPVGIERMARACHARIEGMDGAKQFKGAFRVRHRIAQKGCLIRSHLAPAVARACVPGGRHDRLIVGDLRILDYDPVG